MITYSPKLKPLARRLRSNMTDAEQRLWSKLRRDQIMELRFYRQKPLGSFIVDFYCHAVRLAIEIDGGQHFSSHAQSADEVRTKALNAMGVEVLRFDNLQVLQETDSVMAVVLDVVERRANPNPPQPPFGKGGS